MEVNQTESVLNCQKHKFCLKFGVVKVREPLTLLIAGVERLGCRVSCKLMLWDAPTAGAQELSSAAVESAGDKREDDLSFIRGGETQSKCLGSASQD